MAHEFKGNPLTMYRPRILLTERIKFAAMIGTIAAEWSMFEHVLTLLFAYLVSPDGRTFPSGEATKPVSQVALLTFETIEALKLRLELMKKLVELRLHGQPDAIVKFSNDVVPAIRRAAKLRNKIIHGNWGISDRYPEAIILCPRTIREPFLVYGEKDFTDAIGKIVNAYNTVNTFERDARQRLHGSKPDEQD